MKDYEIAKYKDSKTLIWRAPVIANGGYQGNCSIKVFEVSVMFYSQINSFVANHSSC